MPNYPAKFLPFYLIIAVLFLSLPGFCAQGSLTALQEEAISYREKGMRLQQEGKIEEALAYYQKAVYLDPSYAAAYNDAGVIFEAMGQPEKAKQMYLKAIEVAPGYPNSYSNLALLYEEQKDYANAVLYWVKRATLGGSWDPWAEAARKRLEDIARINPAAYRNIGNEGGEDLQQFETTEPYLNETEFVPSQDSLSVQENVRQLPEEPAEIRERQVSAQEQPEEAMLPGIKESPVSRKADEDKARALEHLKLARQNFSRGEYTAALKEATVAEYLDSSNREISALVNTIRNKLLE